MSTASRSKSSGSRPAAWARAVERASLERVHTEFGAAIKRYRALAGPEQRMALAREITQTRAAELTLAYRNVVAVTSGPRSRGSDATRRRLAPQTPCVIFIVRHKWHDGCDHPASQASLPKHLLTYATDSAGQRQLYAVPTDVQPAQWFARSHAASRSAVRVVPPHGNPDEGTLTCAVALTHRNGRKTAHLLAPLHVLSPVPEANGRPPLGGAKLVQVTTPPSPSPLLGVSQAFGGWLSAAGISFDVQLAGVGPGGASIAALDLSSTVPFVSGREAFNALAAGGRRFEIVLPDNHSGHTGPPRRTTMARFALDGTPMPIEYRVRDGVGTRSIDVWHLDLLVFKIVEGEPIDGGDSGAPILGFLPDGQATLTAMLIGRSPDGTLAYAIPAWQLFSTSSWGALPAGTAQIDPLTT